MKNCRKDKVEYIASSLAHFLSHSHSSYDELFKEVEVSQYINNNETLYLYKTEKEYQAAKYSINLRKNNGVKINIIIGLNDNICALNNSIPNIFFSSSE